MLIFHSKHNKCYLDIGEYFDDVIRSYWAYSDEAIKMNQHQQGKWCYIPFKISIVLNCRRHTMLFNASVLLLIPARVSTQEVRNSWEISFPLNHFSLFSSHQHISQSISETSKQSDHRQERDRARTHCCFTQCYYSSSHYSRTNT